jgi:hypothetical protein
MCDWSIQGAWETIVGYVAIQCHLMHGWFADLVLCDEKLWIWFGVTAHGMKVPYEP